MMKTVSIRWTLLGLLVVALATCAPAADQTTMGKTGPTQALGGAEPEDTPAEPATTDVAPEPTPTQPTDTPTEPAPTSLPPVPTATEPPEAPTEPVAPTETAVLPPTATVNSTETATPLPPSVNVSFILDASGSMLEAMGKRNRLAVAQDAVAALSGGLPSEINSSLWVYGHRVDAEDKAASCKDIEEVIPLAPVDAALFDTVAHSFGAKGYTPITRSIRQAARRLPTGANEHNAIVLVSDGEETCGGDPCALAAAVKASGARVTIHAIGLDASAATRAQLECIAAAAGGTYQDAGSAEELSLALEEATGAVSDEASGVLRNLGRPSSVGLSPDGLHAYVTNPGADTLLVFQRDPGTGKLAYKDVQRNGVGGVDGLHGAFWGAVSPDGASVYTASTHGQVAVFDRDPVTGLLTFVEAHVEGVDGVEGLNGALQVAVSHDGKSVYAVGEESDAIAVFGRDLATGALSFVEALKHGVNGVVGLDGVQAVTTSPDDEYVYTASNPSAKDDALVVFSRDAGRGTLTFLEAHGDGIDGVDGLQGGSSVVTSLDGKDVYVVGRIDEAVAVFRLEGGTGALAFTGANGSDISGKPHAAAISPDGAHLYVVTDQADTLLAFGRSADTGELTFIEMHTDNQDGVDGLEWGNAVSVSPDGRHVYVAGFDDRAVAIFARDPASGELSFVEAVRDVED